MDFDFLKTRDGYFLKKMDGRFKIFISLYFVPKNFFFLYVLFIMPSKKTKQSKKTPSSKSLIVRYNELSETKKKALYDLVPPYDVAQYTILQMIYNKKKKANIPKSLKDIF